MQRSISSEDGDVVIDGVFGDVFIEPLPKGVQIGSGGFGGGEAVDDDTVLRQEADIGGALEQIADQDIDGNLSTGA